MESNKKHHRSQVTQLPIYLGKFFRMFLYMDDWKLIPMGAVVAGLVSMVIRKTMFYTMEGTLKGALAVTCVCIWNGCFNSIQVVCRERGIVKREHRSGMHITSYVFAHMIYQAFLCILQTATTLAIFRFAGVKFPEHGLMVPWIYLDFGITLFLVTYAADMLSLLLSCIAKTTTAAMTLMPFILIFQLVFSGGVFSVPERLQFCSSISITKWGIQSLCAQSDFNDLPAISGWNMLMQMRNYEYEGQKPVEIALEKYGEEELKEEVGRFLGENSRRPEFVSVASNVQDCWLILCRFIGIEALLAMWVLKLIDHDRR